MLSFSQLNLDPQVSKAIISCGYTVPTPIQARCIPEILGGKDIVASSPTGSGKTAAFVLPIIHRLGTTKGGAKPRILILTPTRELASQITQAAGKYGKFLRLNIVSLVGGMPYRQQLKDLSRPVDIIVATPGRLIDHMENQRLDLSQIEMLILDEADRMLDMGFIDDVKNIAKATPSTRQTLLFSATVDDRLSRVINQLLKNPIRIDLSQEKLVPTDIKQISYMADSIQHKMRLLKHLLENDNVFKAIIFSGTKINADRLAKELRDLGYSTGALHGDLRQNVRTRTVEQLRRGKIQLLVATDVAARGIDIADISHVINFDIPKFSEDYIHRIGRTGRAGKSGTAISFILPTDGRHLRDIEHHTGKRLLQEIIPGLEPTRQLSSSKPDGKKRRGNSRSSDRKSHGSSSAPRKASGDWKPRHSGSDDRAPRQASGDWKPRRGGSDDRAPRQASGDWKPRRGGDSDDRAPRQTSGDWKPRRGGDSDDRAPRQASGDWKPRRGGSDDRAPRQASGDWKPRRGGDSDDRAPRQASGDWKPRRGGSDDRAPRQASGDWKPRRGGSDDRAPRQASGDWKPRRGGDSDDRAPRQASGDWKPKRSDSDDKAPRQVSVEWKPRRGSDDRAPRHADSDRKPRRSSDDRAPRRTSSNENYQSRPKSAAQKDKHRD